MRKISSNLKIKNGFSFMISFFTIDHEGVFFASSLTYFLIISLIPIQIIQTFFLNFFGINQSNIMTTYKGVYFNNFISLFYGDSSSITPINIIKGIILFTSTLYIASHGISVFMRICNKLYNKYEKMLRIRLTSLLFFLMITIFFAIFNILLAIFTIIKIKNNIIFYILNTLSNFIAFLFIIYTLYFLGTHKYLKYYQIIPGALCSSIIICLFVNLYYAIISSSIIKEKIYGQFYNGIALLLTIYFISYVLILGIKVNQIIAFVCSKQDKIN